ncbi:MAG: STAS domain-containing protein [Elainellaceae cyanobacterium]
MQPTIEIIQPTGVVDGTQAGHLQKQINEAIDAQKKVILLDLKEVSFMDSSGLAALVIALKTVRAISGRLCVCSMNDQVRMLFELTSMTRVFEIFQDQDAFFHALK